MTLAIGTIGKLQAGAWCVRCGSGQESEYTEKRSKKVEGFEAYDELWSVSKNRCSLLLEIGDGDGCGYKSEPVSFWTRLAKEDGGWGVGSDGS